MDNSNEDTGFKPCPYWWNRGDQVFYACRYELGHSGPHVPVHFYVKTRQDDWELDSRGARR